MSEEGQAPGDGTQSTETPWTDSLPETVRGWDEAKNAKSPEDFWDQMTNHRSMVGRSVQIPTGDASDEAKDAFYDRMKQHFPDITKAPNYDDPETLAGIRRTMGMPEKAENYIPPEFDIPDGGKVDEAKLEGFKTLAYDIGLTQDQYKNMVGKWIGDSLHHTSEQTKAFNGEITGLREEWGAAYDAKHADAEKIRSEFFDFIPAEAMNASSIRAMEKIAAQFGAESPNLTKSADQVRKYALTPAEARQRAAEIMSDKKGPYWDPASPVHATTKEKYRKLMEVANS